MALDRKFSNEYSGHRPPYGSMRPKFEAVHTPIPALAPSFSKKNNAADPLKAVQDEFNAATTGADKAKIANKAQKANPQLTTEILNLALKSASNIDERGALMVEVAATNPAFARALPSIRNDLTAVPGVNFQNAGQKPAALPIAKINLQGASFAAGVDFSGKNLDGANLDGIKAPGLMTAGAHGQFSAHGAQLGHNQPDINTAIQASLGAVTNFNYVKPADLTSSGNIKSGTSPASAPGITSSGHLAKKLDFPTPFATAPSPFSG